MILNGKPYSIKKGDSDWDNVVKAVDEERWEDVPMLISRGHLIEKWAIGMFSFEDNLLKYGGESLPEAINARITKMAKEGKDPSFLLRFWKRLSRNPSYRSVESLYGFLQHTNIPISSDGCLLAYKGVRTNLFDQRTGTIDNSPGMLHQMPRNRISDDPKQSCHFGYHVGDLSYAQGWGPRVVVCKVDPADVVCVPYDSSARKMRVCRYYVLGLHGAAFEETVEEEILDDLEIAGIENYVSPSSFESKRVVPPAATPSTDVVQYDAETAQKTEKGEAVPKLNMPEQDLLTFPLDDLRKFATLTVGIKNAYKIRGGKKALVEAILAAQKQEVTTTEGWERLVNAPWAVLEAATLGDLRKYATHALKVMRASKINGGKAALLEVIKKAREA